MRYVIEQYNKSNNFSLNIHLYPHANLSLKVLADGCIIGNFRMCSDGWHRIHHSCNNFKIASVIGISWTGHLIVWLTGSDKSELCGYSDNCFYCLIVRVLAMPYFVRMQWIHLCIIWGTFCDGAFSMWSLYDLVTLTFDQKKSYHLFHPCASENVCATCEQSVTSVVTFCAWVKLSV